MCSTLRHTRLPMSLIAALVALIVAASLPAFASPDNCLSVKAVQNGGFQASSVVTTSFSSILDGSNNTIFTYTFSGSDGTSVNGIPGLITYCVYPAEPPGNPNSTTPNTGATAIDGNMQAFGANGDAFVQNDSAVGSFSWSRADGNPSNISFDGNTYTMGTATWNAVACIVGGVPTTCPVSPASQTIVLHINDPVECSSLYGGGVAGSVSTCWVFPNGGVTPPPPPSCNGNPACKTAQIFNGNGNEFTTLGNCSSVTPLPCIQVPLFTKLFIDYSYEIIDPTTNNTNNFTMTFKYPPSKTDINNGGGKDYFGCEQVPDPAGFPGTWNTNSIITDAEGNTWLFNLTQGGGTCNQSRFTVLPNPKTIVYTPGQFLTFDVNMNTRANVGKGHTTVVYEYTTRGPHLLNSGFTVKWFQSAPDDNGNCAGGQQVWPGAKSLCSFSTSVTPIYVDAE
jgi:hypothetical protein